LTFYVADSALHGNRCPPPSRKLIPAIFDLMNFRLSLFRGCPSAGIVRGREGRWVSGPHQSLGCGNAGSAGEGRWMFTANSSKPMQNSSWSLKITRNCWNRCTRSVGPCWSSARVKANPALDTAATQLSGISAESTQENIDQRVKAMRDAVDQVYPAH